MGGPQIKKISALEELRRDEGQKHEHSGDKFQVIRIQHPYRNAIATSRRNRTEPITAPVIISPSYWVPTKASPIMTLANPQTTMPIPICTSAKP